MNADRILFSLRTISNNNKKRKEIRIMNESLRNLTVGLTYPQEILLRLQN